MRITRVALCALGATALSAWFVGCGSGGSTDAGGDPSASLEPTLIGTDAAGVQGYAYVPVGASQNGGAAPYAISPCPLGDQLPAPAGTSVQAGASTTETDYLGFFSLEGLAAGRYDLTVGPPAAPGGDGPLVLKNALDVRRPDRPGAFDVTLEPVEDDALWPETLRFIHTVDETAGGGIAFAVCPPGEDCRGASFRMLEALPARPIRFRFHALAPSPAVGTQYPFQIGSGSAEKWGMEVLFGEDARWVLRPGITVAGQTIAAATGGWTFSHVVTTADGRLVGTMEGEVNALLAVNAGASANALPRATRVHVTGQFDLPLVLYTEPREGDEG